MTTEKFTVDGSQVVEKIKELIHQGNIRRVRLIHKGRPLIDIPRRVIRARRRCRNENRGNKG